MKNIRYRGNTLTEYIVSGDDVLGAEDLRGDTQLAGKLIDCAALIEHANCTGVSFAGLRFKNNGTLSISRTNLTDTQWEGVPGGRVIFNQVDLTGSSISLTQLAYAIIDGASTLPQGLSLRDISERKLHLLTTRGLITPIRAGSLVV